MKAIITSVVCIMLCGCGVKGDPLPPERPPELGRGRPTYKEATEPFAYPNLPPVEEETSEEEEENDGEMEE